MKSRELVKVLIAREGITAQKLADMLCNKTNKHYTAQTIRNKIYLSSFRYDEIVAITELLGYSINVDKN